MFQDYVSLNFTSASNVRNRLDEKFSYYFLSHYFAETHPKAENIILAALERTPEALQTAFARASPTIGFDRHRG